MSQTFRIGELSTQLGVPVETIRYFEREGLLTAPSRSGGNYRQFSAAERQRLEFILRCRTLDMTHAEIRRLLAVRDASDQGCAEVNALLDEHIGHVAERIRSLKQLHADLKAIRAHCAVPSSAKDCGILEELAAPAAAPTQRRSRGVHSSHGSC